MITLVLLSNNSSILFVLNEKLYLSLTNKEFEPLFVTMLMVKSKLGTDFKIGSNFPFV